MKTRRSDDSTSFCEKTTQHILFEEADVLILIGNVKEVTVSKEKVDN
jgi:hypothetical protein